MSPVLGPTGTSVTLTGLNFGNQQGSSRVTFGSVSASVILWTDTEIRAVAPALAAGTYDVQVQTSGGISNSLNFLLTVTLVGSDYSVRLEPSSQTVNRGLPGQYRASVIPLNGFNQAVTLSVLGLPTGTSAIFTSNPVVPGQGTDLNIQTTSSTPIGRHTFTIRGSSNGNIRSVTAELIVRPGGAASALVFRRTISQERALLLTFQYRRQDANRITAAVTLSNLTGAWVTATRDFGNGTDQPVVVNDQQVPSVVLLGPLATLPLGEITFDAGQSLQYNGNRDSPEAIAAFALDLFLRGLFARSVPPDLFYNAYSLGDFSSNLSGVFLSAVKNHCSVPGLTLVDSLLLHPSVSGALADTVDFLHCFSGIRKEVSRVLFHILKDGDLTSRVTEALDESLGVILDLLKLPEHAQSVGELFCPSLGPDDSSGGLLRGFFDFLGFCPTLGSSLEGSVRLEATAPPN